MCEGQINVLIQIILQPIIKYLFIKVKQSKHFLILKAYNYTLIF